MVPVDFPDFKLVLRESQQAVYDELDDSCIINAWVSWGKTFTGLAIAGKLGQKTLVITHTVPLRNQWAKEVEKVYGIAPGIIGSGNFNTDSCIVVGNTQTLYRNIDRIRKDVWNNYLGRNASRIFANFFEDHRQQSRTIQNRTEWHNRAKRWKACSLS